MKTRAVIETTAVATASKPTLREITYDVTKEGIEALRAKYTGITFDTPEGYEAGRLALGEVRGLRTAIERRRKDLKQESLDYGRAVDSAAKEWTALVSAIEDPLQAAKDAVDQAAEKAKRDAERAELIALEAKIKADREAAEAALTKQRKADEARMEAERARHEADRAAFAAQQAEADRKRAEEQAALDAQRDEVEAAQRVLAEQKAEAQRVEAERQAAIQAEADAAAAAECEAAEAARLEALRPDIEKVRAWGATLRALARESAPMVDSKDARAAVEWAIARGEFTASTLEKFTPRKGS